MPYVRFISALLLLPMFGLATLTEAQEKKGAGYREKLVGLWEVEKSLEIPKGSTLEFTSDNKVKISVPVDPDKEKDRFTVYPGTYLLEGTRIKVVVPDSAGKDQKQSLKIVELTETRLVTKDEKGGVDEFKKATTK